MRLFVALLLVARSASAQVGRPEEIVALRQLLVGHDFGRLDSALSRRRFEASFAAANENRYAYAYDAFDNGDSTLRPHLDAWVARQPASPRACLARGKYFRAMAHKARGSALAKDTKESQFRRMHAWLTLAVADAAEANRLDSTDIEAHSIVIAAARLTGAYDMEHQVVDQALAVSPTTLLRRTDHMYSLRPRWGGSKEEMDRFAKTAQQYADRNPRLRLLLGYSAFDRGEGLEEDRQYQAAIAAYTKALSHGEFWLYRLARGRTYASMEEPEKALVDFTRVLAERPGAVEALVRRAITYYEVSYLTEGVASEDLLRRGREDLRLATLLDPTDDLVMWTRKNYPSLVGATSVSATRER
jgi:tetratricopeptide (TPR) repeat protein